MSVRNLKSALLRHETILLLVLVLEWFWFNSAGARFSSLDNTFDIAVHWGERPDIHAKPPRDRGADLRAIEPFALDFARFQDIFCQGLEVGLFPKLEAKPLHATAEASLVVAQGRQPHFELLVVPFEPRPIWKLVNICWHSRHILRRMLSLISALLRRIWGLISADATTNLRNLCGD